MEKGKERKKVYVKPTMESEAFVPNSYIAACGDSGKTYLFECNAGSRFYDYKVYHETNGIPGLQTSGRRRDEELTKSGWFGTTYSPCNKTHEASSTNEFLRGYIVPTRGSNVTDVIIWRGVYGNDIHCTTKLDIDSWEIAKS